MKLLSLTKYLVPSALVVGGGFVVYNHGYDNGQNAVQTKFDEYKIAVNERIAEYQTAGMEMRTKIDELNTSITGKTAEEYESYEEYVTDVEYVNREVIKEVLVNSPYLTEGFVYAHDRFVKGQKIDPNLAANTEPSRFTEQEGLDILNRNYSITNQCKQKNRSWNSFYEGVKENYEVQYDFDSIDFDSLSEYTRTAPSSNSSAD